MTDVAERLLLDFAVSGFVQWAWKEGGMTQLAVENLSAQMAKLIRDAQCGEEILFTEHNKPVARIVPVLHGRAARKAGSARRLLHFMADDFDTTPDGFEEYMP